jgi:hypothetical protein
LTLPRIRTVSLRALTVGAAAEQVIRLLTARATAAEDDLDLGGHERAQREVHAVLSIVRLSVDDITEDDDGQGERNIPWEAAPE